MIPFDDDELVEPVKAALGKQLYILEQDGGGLEFLGVKNGVVFVHLTPLKDSLKSTFTLKSPL